MIVIIINAEGTARVVTPSRIFQGSNQSAVTVIAPIPTTTAMSIAFKLPDGTSTPYYPMTWIQADNGLSQYEFTLNAPLTQKAGHAAIALMALYTDGRQTSQLVDFEIEKSIVPEVPADIDEGAYEEILKSLQKDRTDITALQGQMNDIQETADKAEEAANNAVETANEAKSTADGLADSIAQANTTAENAVNIANGAVATANEAKATADGLAESIAQANAKADTAISTANEANTTAEEAKEIAQEALDQSKVTGTKVNVDGVFQTDLEFSSDPQTQISGLYTRAQELENSKVNKAGDTMTGNLKFAEGGIMAKQYGNTVFPLPQVPYEEIEPTNDTATYLKELLKWICRNFPDVESGTWIGRGAPNSQGTCIISIYNTNEVNAEGLPRYSDGIYRSISASMSVFNTNDYAYSYEWIDFDASAGLTIQNQSTDGVNITAKIPCIEVGKLEPSTANGWTIGGNKLIIPGDGVYLLSIKISDNQNFSQIAIVPVNGDLVRGYSVEFFTSYTAGTGFLIVSAYYRTPAISNWSATLYNGGGSVTKDIYQVAYKRIA